MKICIDNGAYQALVSDLERKARALRCDGGVVVPQTLDVKTVKRFSEVLDRLERVIDSYADLGGNDARRFREAGDSQVERDRMAGRG